MAIATALSPSAHAEFLYNSFLVPSFDGEANTEYSRWNIFYNANLGENFPDVAAPNGVYGSASSAGFTAPAGSAPSNPLAYWAVGNPTITQTNPGVAFIIGPAVSGNIYSFSAPTAFLLEDITPYSLGTVVFQFATEGTRVAFDSIRLEYDTAEGTQSIRPAEYIREFSSGTSSFGGVGSRVALQWNLTGLNLDNYRLVWEAAGSSLSFQEALLDTAAVYASVVPESRTWIANGSALWSDGSNWLQGSTSVENGNVRFNNSSGANISLDGNRTVGEIIMETDSDLTISGSSKLTANTGITTMANADGTYIIQTAYELGAYNIMEINAGEVQLNGVVSGNYGLNKVGNGTLVLGNNNTFGSTGAGIGVQGGTLRINGTNAFTGSTAVLWGRLEVGADAFNNVAGALGNASSAITVGASSDLFPVSDVTAPAQLVIVGNHTLQRNVTVEQGTFEKRLGAINTGGNEALFSGNVLLQGSGVTATSLKLFAQSSNDFIRFSGNLSGGSTSANIQINADGETGTVVFSGNNKTYVSNTQVSGGTLRVNSGTSVTGNGNWTVASGAVLEVNGTVGGSGSFSLSPDAKLTGSGVVNKSVVVGGGAVIAPGNSTGTISTLSQTWSGAGVYEWEISDVSLAGGWDRVAITGTLTLTASELQPFILELMTLDASQQLGLVGNFNEHISYSWIIASASGGIVGFNSASFLFDSSGFQNTLNGNFDVSQIGNNIVLNYEAIPEPHVWALFFVGALFLFARRFMPLRQPT